MLQGECCSKRGSQYGARAMSVKLAVTVFVGLMSLLISVAVQAFDPRGAPGSLAAPVFDVRMQDCFSRAMVGMDSVINSRLGVPAEHALALSVRDEVGGNHEAVFDEPLLAMILTAYLWKDSAHSYAIKVFYDCAASPSKIVERGDFLP